MLSILITLCASAGSVNGLVDSIDISNAVLCLASDESRYVTGTELKIDAGVWLQPPHRAAADPTVSRAAQPTPKESAAATTRWRTLWN